MAKAFDKVANKISNFSKKVSNKTKEIAKVTQLKFDLSSEEGKFCEKCEELGKAFYEQAKSGAENSEVIAKLVCEADEIKAKIAELEKQIEEAQK